MNEREPGSDELLPADARTVIMGRYDTEQLELDAEEAKVRQTAPLEDR